MDYCDKLEELEQKIKTLEDKVFGMNRSPEKNEQSFADQIKTLRQKTQSCYRQFYAAQSDAETVKIDQVWQSAISELETLLIKEYERIKEAVKNIPFGYIAESVGIDPVTGYRKCIWKWSATEPTKDTEGTGYVDFNTKDVSRDEFKKIRGLMKKYGLDKFCLYEISGKKEYPLCFKCGKDDLVAKESKESKSLNEVAKMFKHGWLCQDEERIMWVPKRPKGLSLWNKQKGGVELNVEIEKTKNPCYVDCKTGKKFSRIWLKDVEFQEYDDYRCRKFTLEELEEQFICIGNSFTVKVMKGNEVLRDDETLEHLIDEINATYEDWNAIKGRFPETICLIKMWNKEEDEDD